MPQAIPMSRVKTRNWVVDSVVTGFQASDTHLGVENTDTGNPNVRLVAAMNAMPGRAHPLHGLIDEPDAVFVTGDCVHENAENTTRFSQYYRLDGTGEVPWPAYISDGNHDRQQVRDLILARHKTLTWGVKIKHVYFQNLTERYISDVDNHPPGTSQITGVAANIATRPKDEPTVIIVHRATTGGYAAEWDRTALTTTTTSLNGTDVTSSFDVASTAGLVVGKYIQIDSEEMLITGIASLTVTATRQQSGTVKTTHSNGATVYGTDSLDALRTMAAERRTLFILNGHNHTTRHETWRGVRVFSPGSVTQSSSSPPYSTIYPEAFNVFRIGHDWYDVANFNFGYTDAQQNPRVWNPDTWNWTETVRF